MNTARNDITGRVIKTGPSSSSYRDGWDEIFNKSKKEQKKKLVLASASWCGPCQILKKRLVADGLYDKIEHKDADVDFAFCRENNVKSIPRLFVFEDDKMVDFLLDIEEIYNRIKSEQ